MVVRRLGVVRVQAGDGARYFAVRRELFHGPAGTCIVLRPEAELSADGLSVPGTVPLRPFSLSVRGGKACFDRDIRLPVPLRGLGLGTFFLSTLVRLAVRLGHGDARVRALHLVARDHTPLREHFYRSMCFSLTLWRDGTGWARAARLADLRAQCDPAKVRELSEAEAALLLAAGGGPGMAKQGETEQGAARLMPAIA